MAATPQGPATQENSTMPVATAPVPPVPTKTTPVWRKPAVLRLMAVALTAEIAYAVMNLSTMQVYLKYDRQFGEGAIGWVLVAFLLCEAVFKSPMGHLADRHGPKRLMLFGPLLSVGTSLVSLVVPHLGGSVVETLLFVALRAIDGLGAAMLWPAAFSAVNATVQDEERQQAMSLLNLCYMLGIALAFPLGGLVNSVFAAHWAGLVLAAVLFALVAGAVALFVPANLHAASDGEHSEAGFADFLNSMRQIPQYLILAAVTFAGIGFPMAIFKLFPIDEFHYSELQVGGLIGPGALVMGLASVPMSHYGERIGRVKAVHLGMALCALGLWLIGLGMVIVPLRHPWVLALGGIPVGIGFLLAIPAWMASVSDIDPQRRGVNLGAIMTAQGLGAIIGAPIGAKMYESLQPVGVQLGLGSDFGRYSPFVGCAACVTFGWLLSLRLLQEPAKASEAGQPVN